MSTTSTIIVIVVIMMTPCLSLHHVHDEQYHKTTKMKKRSWSSRWTYHDTGRGPRHGMSCLVVMMVMMVVMAMMANTCISTPSRDDVNDVDHVVDHDADDGIAPKEQVSFDMHHLHQLHVPVTQLAAFAVQAVASKPLRRAMTAHVTALDTMDECCTSIMMTLSSSCPPQCQRKHGMALQEANDQLRDALTRMIATFAAERIDHDADGHGGDDGHDDVVQRVMTWITKGDKEKKDDEDEKKKEKKDVDISIKIDEPVSLPMVADVQQVFLDRFELNVHDFTLPMRMVANSIRMGVDVAAPSLDLVTVFDASACVHLTEEEVASGKRFEDVKTDASQTMTVSIGELVFDQLETVVWFVCAMLGIGLVVFAAILYRRTSYIMKRLRYYEQQQQQPPSEPSLLVETNVTAPVVS